VAETVLLILPSSSVSSSTVPLFFRLYVRGKDLSGIGPNTARISTSNKLELAVERMP